MRIFNKYIGLLFAATLGLTACQDFDDPAVASPESTWLADSENYQLMSISDFKTEYWQDAENYYATVGEAADGKHVLVKGRVISSDASGNIYKSLVIQDETGALAMSINANSMNNKYRRGQELVIDVTGMTVGKYAGLQQLGFPEDSESYGAQTTFMPYAFFEEHAQMQGRPEPADVDTITVRSLAEISGGGAATYIKWQSQLVRFNDVYFADGGKETFAASKETVNRTLTLADGGSLTVRTSGYSNFYDDMLPEGHFDIVGILGYHSNGGWQLTLIDRRGCMNVGNPTQGPGAEDNPYTVDEALSVINGGGSDNGIWLTGYIVGAVAPGVQSVTSNSDIQFMAEVDLDNTLVIASDPECKDWTKCMVVSLPQDSKLRQYGNLADNPANYKKQIWLKGNLGSFLDMGALTGNNGAPANFRIEGVEVPDEGGNLDPDFNTMNNGEATGYYNTLTSATGWVATNSQLLRGGDTDQSPVFKVFGDASVYAVSLNGNTSKPGTLTSPTISGGLKTLSFNYTQVFNDNGKAKLTINVKQNGAVVASDVLDKSGITKFEKCVYSHDFNITGSYVLEIINDCPSGVAENKDRIAIWNLTDGTIGGGDTPVDPTPSDAVTSLNETFPGKAIPAGWTNLKVAGDKAWYATEFNSQPYAACTGYKGTTPPYDAWLISPAIDLSKVADKKLAFDTQVNGYGSTTTVFEVYVMTSADPAKGTKTKLNPALPTAPASGYSGWVNSGSLDLSSFSGTVYIGFRYYATSDAQYATWCVTNVKLNAGGGDTPVDPNPGPVTGTSADFSSFGQTATTYGTYTSSTGWVAEWAQILSGSATPDNKSTFALFGTDKDFAVCLNGRLSKVGKLTSPTISGGIKTMSFDYAYVYTEGKKCQLTINIKQNGAVVATDVLTNDAMTKNTKYTYTHAFNVSGDFVIEIVNDCPSSNDAGNKDRTAIWNLTWTK